MTRRHTPPRNHLSDWDRFEITAQLRRRGLTWRALDAKYGYRPDCLRQVLMKPWPRAEEIVAGEIGVAVETIWPTPVADRRLQAAA